MRLAYGPNRYITGCHAKAKH